jgi:AAA family ATPase
VWWSNAHRVPNSTDEYKRVWIIEANGCCSGAELVGICQKACDRLIDRALDTEDFDQQIHMEDFLEATKLVKKQITPEMIEKYKRWAAGLGSGSD